MNTIMKVAVTANLMAAPKKRGLVRPPSSEGRSFVTADASKLTLVR
jgi:hypothetical protein